jgi:hypothetical protein
MVSTKKNVSSGIVSAAASLVALGALLALGACSSGGGGGDGGGGPPPKTTYTGTIYMASTSGGHIAVIPVTIDPSNATTPFELGSVSRIQLSSSTGAGNQTHNFHDVRLDGDTLYYTTIVPDSSGGGTNGMAHVGALDLTAVSCGAPNCTFTQNDAAIDVNAGAGMIYCGSGQTGTHLVPMTMSYPAYIDAIAKSAITNGATLASGTADVKRTFVDDFRADADYIFAHGINNPARTRLFVAVNDTNAGQGGTAGGMSGSVTSYLLDMADVVAGTVDATSVVTTSTVSGLAAAGATIAFRSTYTPDGTRILQAGKDRLLVLDAATLDPLDNNTTIGGSFTAIENHDVMPTPDGKYAILALRFKHAPGEQQDSGLQLYDLAKKQAIGAPVSACNGCHSSAVTARATCGLDGSLTAVTQ